MTKRIRRNDYLTPEQARAMLEQAVQDLLHGKNPGSVTFRLKPSRKANEPYLIKLTETQRQSLIECTGIKKKLKERLRNSPGGTQAVGFVRKELDHLNEQISESAYYARSPHKRRLKAIQQKIEAIFTAEIAPFFHPAISSKPTPLPLKIYQFKITLLDIKPLIWRRIQMEEGSLADLHECIQGAFGWWDCHLHQFRIDGERYAPTPPEGYDLIEGTLPEESVLFGDIVPANGQQKRWLYEYDFGDGWRHEVLFEGHPPTDKKRAYPWCVEGERACPPEDCGGPYAYPDYLEAISNPDHEQHEELLAWRGPFDPDAFDAKKATSVMRRRL